MEIAEVFDDIGDSFKKGGNGKLIVGVVFVVLFAVIYFTKSRQTSEEPVKITGAYASYPDAVTNADVIISTLQNNLDYTSQEIKDFLENDDKVLIDSMNQLAQDGFNKADEISDKIGMFEEKMTVELESLGTNVKNSIPSTVYVPMTPEKTEKEKHLEPLKKDGLADFETSHGITLEQLNGFIGTSFHGSVVNGASTTAGGGLILYTEDGNRYEI